MAPRFFQKAEETIRGAEASIRGDSWVSEVADKVPAVASAPGTTTTERLQFHNFDQWKAKYEPEKEKKEKKEDSERVKAAKAKVKSKAQEVVLNKIHEGMSSKMVQMLLEVSSKVLSQAEDFVSKGQLPASLPAAGKDLPATTQLLLNTMNGIVLTYRFQQPSDVNSSSYDDRKFGFIRKQAIDQLASILQNMTPSSSDGGDSSEKKEKLDDVLAKATWIEDNVMPQMTATLMQCREHVKPLVMEQLDAIFGKVSDAIDTGVEQAMVDVDQKVQETQQQVEQMSVTAQEKVADVKEKVEQTFDKELVVDESKLNDLKEQVTAKVGEVKETTRTKILEKREQKEETMIMLVQMCKSFILQQMETVGDHLVVAMENIFVTYSAILRRLQEKKQGVEETLASIQEELHRAVEKVYADMVLKVGNQVMIVTDTLSLMMDSKSGEDENEGQE